MAREPSPRKLPSWLQSLGPGLITGAADDDPSGIATYSQAGAQFGPNMLWTMGFTYPLMAGVQVISARIGRVTGLGLAGNIRAHYSRPMLYLMVILLMMANTINIAADVAAMGEAMHLIVDGNPRWYAAGFGLVSLLLQVFIPYTRYVRILKWLTLALLAYVATVLTVRIPWGEVLRAFVWPDLPWNKASMTTLVAVFGTTISPYLFFWQASQEVEELNASEHARPLRFSPRQARASFARIQFDTWTGMAFSNIVALCIMLTTAITLHAHGVTEIQTSAQAASALRPVAGDFAFFLFAMGIIGTGMLGLPVLAGSAAYAMADTFRWREGLERRPAEAKGFYAIISLATLGGIAIGFLPLDPIQALYWSAVLNGVIAVPVMAIMMLMASNKAVMGRFAIPSWLRWLGWTATLAMASAVFAMALLA
ncbi:NRAMP family divalent metal transporter [Massilia sp. TS11]|uniref:NRAMP family divalent metal transporter n=1 Tax=Massilia sp. TS11 TaxID=2908003 RepID=UPI001EDAD2C1|nr:divalent metal cation transporter [Massilia sp. TS11]MCG2585077.1 divalent metal cation transporter [Massilia sp. TS11]